MFKGLGVGRIVHFTAYPGPMCLAAIVTKVVDKENGIVNLSVFVSDGSCAISKCEVGFSDSRCLLPAIEGTWHWPERED